MITNEPFEFWARYVKFSTEVGHINIFINYYEIFLQDQINIYKHVVVVVMICNLFTIAQVKNLNLPASILWPSAAKSNPIAHELHCILLDYKFTLYKYDISHTRFVGLVVHAVEK